MRKSIITLMAVSSLLLVGCSQNPATKVDQLRDGKEKNLEDSGYNECMRQVNATEEKHKQCVSDKLVVLGYSDGINCLSNPDNTICRDTKRYNAQVNASNDCNAEVYTDKTLSQIDCLKLLNK